ncbi:hypothetical protein [Enterococcus sp. 5B3_DIV0040]|uniref:hypothetical protein n=1 Tax=Enterococcus sp. 5B3_DIV0040 TaxID=1834182 RepID=UPI000A34BAAC|nr:hypothetical protein [Enterococcus sp. 5B3_DIV0040]OTO02228.1 hypothetical protein A5883_003055 [Enterococcus sp. 5B3_DIV0040]
MRLYIVQKFYKDEHLENPIFFYNEDLMIQYLREINQSSFFNYKGIVVEPFYKDINRDFFVLDKSISELFDEFRKNIKPEYQFLAQELFYRFCPFCTRKTTSV